MDMATAALSPDSIGGSMLTILYVNTSPISGSKDFNVLETYSPFSWLRASQLDLAVHVAPLMTVLSLSVSGRECPVGSMCENPTEKRPPTQRLSNQSSQFSVLASQSHSHPAVFSLTHKAKSGVHGSSLTFKT